MVDSRVDDSALPLHGNASLVHLRTLLLQPLDARQQATHALFRSAAILLREVLYRV